MGRKKILYVATEDWYFVSDTLPLARAALDAGYDVCVAAREGSHRATIEQAGITFYSLDQMSRAQINPLAQSFAVKELRDLTRRLAPDLVHNIALKPTLYGLLSARDTARTAVVNSIMGLGYVFAENSGKAQALRVIVKRAMMPILNRARSRTVFQNSDDLALMADLLPAARPNLRLVKGSGVNTSAFMPSPEPGGVPVAVLAARLLRHKGVAEFVAAAQRIKADGVQARFALVGEPDPDNHASVTRAELAEWTSRGLVEHWGFRSDMPSVYAATSVFCLPTFYREGLPRVLLEAAACGRALVATDVPGCREIVRPGVNGWLVPPRDAAALTHALKAALFDPALRVSYGAAGRKMVEEEFSAQIIIGQTLDIYHELLSG